MIKTFNTLSSMFLMCMFIFISHCTVLCKTSYQNFLLLCNYNLVVINPTFLTYIFLSSASGIAIQLSTSIGTTFLNTMYKIVQYLFSCAWLIPFQIMISGSIPVVTNGEILNFLWLRSIPLCICATFLNHSLVCRHLFPFLRFYYQCSNKTGA